jgi:non-ribosomal peptide synthetase component E (peptide arylation enzyme)
VADGSGAPVVPGTQGELCVAGDQVAGRYLNAPDLTAQAFQHLPGLDAGELYYRTGDVVRQSAQHYLYDGRMDDQIQVGGHRVELGEVEYQARKLVRLQQVAALASLESETFVRIVLCVEGSEVPDLMSGLRAALPSYMVPHQILSMPAFPLTASGKIDKKRLQGMIGHG